MYLFIQNWLLNSWITVYFDFSSSFFSFLDPRGQSKWPHIFHRPCVAGAVLQTPLLLINSVTQSSFSSKSSKYLHSKTVKARELTFWENVHLPPCVMCRMSRIMCHVWPVTCHVSYVTISFSFSFFLQRGEASQLRVCYQRGLPCLFF